MKVAPLALLAVLVVPLHAQGPNDFDASRVRQLLASIQKQLPEAARDVGWLTNTVPQKGTIPAEVGQQLEAFEQALRSGANKELRSLIREELEIKADRLPSVFSPVGFLRGGVPGRAKNRRR